MKSATCNILADYQKQIGNNAPIKPPFVITGQQVGFMGGPLYTFSKILSCILCARALNATPLFWAATEDHDVHEVNHCTVLNTRGDLKRYRVSLPENHFVEDLPLTCQAEIEQFCHDLNMPLWPFSDRYAETMIRLLVRAFAGTGLLFIEPYLLRPLAADFFAQELEHTIDLPPGPIHHKPTDTHLFYKTDEGLRKKIRKGEKISLPPERLSTNVASRPVLQSLLLDTAAYIAGPTELVYHKQLGELFDAHNVQMPPILPRLSLTLIPPEANNKHYVHNLMRPRGRPQERILNWWMFHTDVHDLLAKLEWNPGASYLISLEGMAVQ